MTVATTDGATIWAFRYSSEGRSRSLFYTTDVPTLRALYPDNVLLEGLSDDARVIVSEPLGDLPGVWNEVPESTYGVVCPGHDAMAAFAPRLPV
jgi:glutamine amidotransferase